jgi:hypothetical protein
MLASSAGGLPILHGGWVGVERRGVRLGVRRGSGECGPQVVRECLDRTRRRPKTDNRTPGLAESDLKVGHFREHT